MDTALLTRVDIGTLHRVFLGAFSDYLFPMQPSQEQLLEMMTRRGCDLSISVGTFVDGTLAGFTLNALDEYEGIPTVYDLGSGVLPEYRRQGIAAALMRSSMDLARERGASQYILEVLEGNHRAALLYQKVGFRLARKLELYRGRLERQAVPDSALQVREIEPDWNAFKEIWNWTPSWQNSSASIQRSKAPWKALGVFRDSRWIGYGIVYPDSGDIPQLCVHRDFRGQGAGTLLLTAMQDSRDAEKPVRILNVDGADIETCRFLSGALEHFGAQLEMKLRL